MITRLRSIDSRWPKGRRPHLQPILPAVILGALLLLFFNKMAFGNLILARGDTFLYFYPYWQSAADALHQGRVPLWNPQIFMGSPFLANSQVGFFYPLNWPFWWLLPIPYAVSASILLHLMIAAWGAYVAGRHIMSLGKAGALFSAMLFALGGYLTAQVEHVNQLQGLAWLPWLFVILDSCGNEGPHRITILRKGLVFALVLLLQLLAGHIQTTFISVVGLAIWSAGHLLTRSSALGRSYALRFTFYAGRFRVRAPLVVLLGVVLALLMAAVQLLPTFELAGLSSRRGGLAANAVLSFSLHPLLAARALLPGYRQSLFSEYVAFLPITALVLAAVGAWQWRRWRGVFPALLLVLAGLMLAFGAYNPLNWLLAPLPGFSLFRVPARWLILYTFGLSMLAGLGMQIVFDLWLQRTRPWAELPGRVSENLWHMERPIRFAVVVILGLMAWGAIATILAAFVPTGPEAPFEAPERATVLAWGAELLVLYMLLADRRLLLQLKALGSRAHLSLLAVPVPHFLFVLCLLILYGSTRALPYNNLTTPEAYFELRPSLARLRAETGCLVPGAPCQIPPARLLSLSDILFDPGDQAEIDSIYADQLPPAALYDYIVAVKQKEIVAPNLPLTYGLHSVDGFDGGILPLRSYTLAMQLILPQGVAYEDGIAADGRLREYLDTVPEAKWLDLFNAGYLITDKVGDAWHHGVYFDQQHPVNPADGETVSVGFVPSFEATDIWLLASGRPGLLRVTAEDGRDWQLEAKSLEGNLYRLHLPEPVILRDIELLPCRPPTSCQVFGVTLVDYRDGSFQSIVPGNYRLIHSGDVKIYQNLDVLPRAFLVHSWQWKSDMNVSLEAMLDSAFDPRRTAVIIGEENDQQDGQSVAPQLPGHVTVRSYEPERIEIATNSVSPGLLLVTDAYYPGWTAELDGKTTPLYQADILFRGVMVPAGEHEILFTFQPASFRIGRTLSLVGILVWSLGAVTAFTLTTRSRRQAPDYG